MNVIYTLKPEIKLINQEYEDKYYIQIDKRYWLITENIYIIASVLYGQTITEIMENLIEQYDFYISKEKLLEVLEKIFITNGFLVGTDLNCKKNKNSFLWFRKKIIKKETLKNCSFLKTIFLEKSIRIISIVLLLFYIYLLATKLDFKIIDSIYELSIYEMFVCFIVIFIFGIIHELGHSMASLYSNNDPADIGIGIYFIMPVLYSDVTSSWILPRKKRMLVDFGGIYLQGISIIIVQVINVFFIKSSVLEIAIYISSFQILLNLNPFLKFDGYWILLDYLDEISLIDFLKKQWILLYDKYKYKKNIQINLKRLCISIIYTLFSIPFIVYFIIYLTKELIISIQKLYIDIINIQMDEFNLINILRYFIINWSYFIPIIFILFMLYKIYGSLVKKNENSQ